MKIKDLEVIKKIEKRDLFDRNHKFEIVKLDDNFPKYINENQQKFKDFIYSN